MSHPADTTTTQSALTDIVGDRERINRRIPLSGFVGSIFGQGRPTTPSPQAPTPEVRTSRNVLLPDGRVLNTTSGMSDEEIIEAFNARASGEVAARAKIEADSDEDEFEASMFAIFKGQPIAEIDLGGGRTQILFRNPSTGVIDNLGEGMTEEEAARRSQTQLLNSILPFLQLDQQGAQADRANDSQRQGLLFQAQQASESNLNSLIGLGARDSLAARAGASNLIGGTLSSQERDTLFGDDPRDLVQRLEDEVSQRSSRTLFGEQIPTEFANLLAATGTSPSELVRSSLRRTIPGTEITQELAGIFAGLTPGNEIPSDLSSREQLRSGPIQALVTRGILSPEQARELEAAVNFGGVSPEVISGSPRTSSGQRFSSRIVRR